VPKTAYFGPVKDYFEQFLCAPDKKVPPPYPAALGGKARENFGKFGRTDNGHGGILVGCPTRRRCRREMWGGHIAPGCYPGWQGFVVGPGTLRGCVREIFGASVRCGASDQSTGELCIKSCWEPATYVVWALFLYADPYLCL